MTDRLKSAMSAPPRSSPSVAIQCVLSLVLVGHFAILALSYFNNTSESRSDISDKLIEQSQPYLMGLNWHVESLPIALTYGTSRDAGIRIDLKRSVSDSGWTPVLSTTKSHPRWRRMTNLIGALVEHDDPDGLGLIAFAVIQNIQKSEPAITRIRFVREASRMNATDELLYEAAIIELDGEKTLVPIIDPTRTVPPVGSDGQQRMGK